MEKYRICVQILSPAVEGSFSGSSCRTTPLGLGRIFPLVAGQCVWRTWGCAEPLCCQCLSDGKLGTLRALLLTLAPAVSKGSHNDKTRFERFLFAPDFRNPDNS